MKLLDRIQLSGKYQFMFGYPYHQIGIDRQHFIPSAARGAQPAGEGGRERRRRRWRWRQGRAAWPASDRGREGWRGLPAREAGSSGSASRVEDKGGERDAGDGGDAIPANTEGLGSVSRVKGRERDQYRLVLSFISNSKFHDI